MTRRVTITLPRELHDAVERARRSRRQSRSAFITDSVSRQIRSDAEQAKEAAWIEGYRRQPLTKEELQLSEYGLSVLEGDQSESKDEP